MICWSRLALVPCALIALVSHAPVGAQSAHGWNELGTIAYSAGRFALALEHFEKAIALEPENHAIRRNVCAAHQGMANQLAETGDFAAAAARVAKGLEVDPKNPDALAQAGSYQLALGKPGEAEAYLRPALEAMPDHPHVRFLLGEVYYRQNKLEDARKLWSRLLASKPDWPGLQSKYDKLMRETGVEGGFEAHQGEHFQLSYGKVLSEEMRQTVLALLEEAYTTVGEKLGGLFPRDTVQVVLYEGEEFAAATETKEHVGALFDGKIRAPITSRNGRYLTRRVLETRLTHEYVHVVLAAHLGGKTPWWLNEGLAETLSRAMDRRRSRIVAAAYRGDSAQPLAMLERVDLGGTDPEALAQTYAQAHAAVQLLWERGGTGQISALIQALRAGKNPEEALSAACGMDYAALESALAAAYP